MSRIIALLHALDTILQEKEENAHPLNGMIVKMIVYTLWMDPLNYQVKRETSFNDLDLRHPVH